MTSATGGFIQPAVAPAPLEGAALLDVLQAWFVGLSGLAGTMVRPRWVPEPANIPESGTAWMAFGVINRPSDFYPTIVHNGAGDGSDQLQRNEFLDILCSFYDTGSTGLADQYAALVRDNTAIPQNYEFLQAQNIEFVSANEPLTVPSLLKLRWLYRVDLPVMLRRQINRDYPVLNVLSADGGIYTDTGLGPFPIVTEEPNP